MTIKLGIVMDPIESIKPRKDSSLAMLLAAQKRGWHLYYMQQQGLYLNNGIAYAQAHSITVQDDEQQWFNKNKSQQLRLHELDIILMRVDPPADANYIYTTQILDQAASLGSLVINRPSSLRDINEKLFIAQFPDLCVPTLVSANHAQLMHFLDQHKTIIVKPLDGMGGRSIFLLHSNDPNAHVIFEVMTKNSQQLIMVQRYIPEITKGDKRILLINGEPIPYAYARIPAKGEHRGNLAAGGSGEGRELNAQDKAICQALGPVLREKGVLFAGIDVIGEYLTEVNVTSPTCIRELDALYQLDIANQLLEEAEKQLKR